MKNFCLKSYLYILNVFKRSVLEDKVYIERGMCWEHRVHACYMKKKYLISCYTTLKTVLKKGEGERN